MMQQKSTTLRDWIFLYNPAYLLSAVCMLASCVMLVHDTEEKLVSVAQVLSVVGALTLYQLALFAIGTFLTLGRGIVRDGRSLLIIDAFFLADVTFVGTTLVMNDLRIGFAVGLMVAALAAARIHWIARRLGNPLPFHRYLVILLQLILLPAIPAALKHFDTGTNITPKVLYALWWLLGAIPFAAVLMDRADPTLPDPAAARARRAQWIAPAYLLIPWISLILHLALLHYVYKVAFFSAMLTPILLAGALGLSHALARQRIRRAGVGTQVVMVLLALVWGIGPNRALNWVVGGMTITPNVLTLASVYIAVVTIYFARHALAFLASGGAAGLLALFGPTPAQIAQCLANAIAGTCRFIAALFPSTRIGWGILGIIASFALLALGLLISLSKPNQEETPAPERGPEPDPAQLPPTVAALIPPTLPAPDESAPQP